MAFERKKLSNERLKEFVKLIDPMVNELELDLPVKMYESIMLDEERGIYYVSIFTGGGGVSPAEYYILEKAGPYSFDGSENNPLTPYHWPALQAVVTPENVILITSFEFSVANPQEKKAVREFYISSLSIKSLANNQVVDIRLNNEVPRGINELIEEIIQISEEFRKIANWSITTSVKYNLEIDMLKGLHNKDWMEN